MKNKGFVQLCWCTLFVIYLVIIAGSVVRMTGSGMGCPDWPKCFGYLIPPSDEEQVIFHPNTGYFKGQMIVSGDELLSAKSDFVSSSQLIADDWEVYEKHNYATFNPAHTWTEYINRLAGAISGFFMLAVLIWSFVLFFQKRASIWLFVLSFFGVILLGFQAWLGKTVVDSNLQAGKITAHMFGAVALIAVVLLIIRLARKKMPLIHSNVKLFAFISLILLLIQIYLGTDFRVYVDNASGHTSSVGQFFPEIFKTFSFKLHRSFAWVVLIAFSVLLYKAFKEKEWAGVFSSISFFLMLEIALGIGMSYFQFPFLTQPLHLLSSMVLFGNLFWILLFKKER